MALYRLIQDGARSGCLNMAIDEALLRYANELNSFSTTLRLYTWAKPTISLGFAQTPEKTIDLEYCARHKLDVVRRPTGGRAVLHDHELTYAVISNDFERFGGNGIPATYFTISGILRAALHRLGCSADVSPGKLHRNRNGSYPGADSTSSRMNRVDPCFLSTSRFEITVGGRKLVGSAQRRLKRAFLQHGSILLKCHNYPVHAAALGADPGTLRHSLVGLEEHIPRENLTARLRQMIPKSFEEALDVVLVEKGLLQEESLLALHYERMGRYRCCAHG